MDSDLIKRNLAISYATSGFVRRIDGEDWIRISEVRQSLNDVPTANTVNISDEYKTCKGCKYYSYGCFDGHPCIHCQRNSKLVDEIREQQNDRWKDGTTNG